MEGQDAQPELTERLEETLASIPDQQFVDSLRTIYVAAARGIARLGALDLVRYDAGEAESSADLSMWEEMAPILADTVQDVNALVALIRERFPGGHKPTSPDVDVRKMQRVEQALRLGAEDLVRGVTELGEHVRSPAVVSDRWNLLAELQDFRSRFREQLGNLVYETADMIAPVTREQVVPGLAEDVQTAVVVRATVADLRRLLAARAQKVREAEQEDVQWNAEQLERELDMFGRTPAYRWLPVPDKRQVVEQRAALVRLAAQPQPAQADLIAVVDGLLGVMEDASTRPQPLLEEHDRETWAAVGVGLEQTTLILDTDAAGAAQLLGDAVATAQKLYGRSSPLDAYLRRIRKTPPSDLPAEQLPQLVEEFREILAGFAVL